MVLQALQAGKQTYTKKMVTLIRTFFNFFWTEWGLCLCVLWVLRLSVHLLHMQIFLTEIVNSGCSYHSALTAVINTLKPSGKCMYHLL
jgi:hypothetical protein